MYCLMMRLSSHATYTHTHTHTHTYTHTHTHTYTHTHTHTHTHQDGWVCRNDQLLCINGQSLLGRSNHEALEVLRGALASASVKSSTIQLMVARRAGINRKAALSMGSFSSSMAALGEEPEEVCLSVCLCTYLSVSVPAMCD